MAKIVFGAIVTDMRGKVGATVFSRNKSGAYARSFKETITSNTAAQIITRARLGSLSTGWRSLTAIQRDSWNNSVAAFKHTNVFGSLINPSGFDLFVKLNCNLLQVGLPQINTAPVPGVVLNVSGLTVSADGTTPQILLNFDASALSVNYSLIINATACISAGKQYVKNLLREISIIAPSVVVPLDVTADYITKFTSIFASMRISVSIVAVNKTTGQKSEPIQATCIVDGLAGLDYNQALDTGIPLA